MPFEHGSFVLDLEGALLFAGGEMGSVLNPEGEAIVITEMLLYVETPSTGSANIDVGIGVAATTDATDLISALAINGSLTGKVYSALAKTASLELVTWPATSYLNATGSASTVGFKGKLLVKFMHQAA